MVDLISALLAEFSGYEQCISITGSGGKTTALIALAAAYAETGKRVLVSTTTKLELPEQRAYGCDRYVFDGSVLEYRPLAGQRVFYALQGTHKALAPPIDELQRLLQFYDVLLLEADGALHKQLKLHTERDPVVPYFTTATLAVVGFGAMGKSLRQTCYGCESLVDGTVDWQTYRMLLTHPQGITKNMKGKKVILCNEAQNTDASDIQALSHACADLPLWFGSLSTNALLQRNKV
ncbi:MAG: selenium cofactor biosynthesis protein YqeC [Sphaerochaeta sp.]|jgi:probable selenium-dependent hydroxylase accessory protein YqeC|uniref:selenium cofactor biosynthesis protein YqeC n=1 Tax=Sphaerochaeta sp. TaxID=1972642 RepID=UPI002FC6B040